MQANVSKLNYLVALTMPLFAFCAHQTPAEIIGEAFALIRADHPDVSLEIFAWAVRARYAAFEESARMRAKATAVPASWHASSVA